MLHLTLDMIDGTYRVQTHAADGKTIDSTGETVIRNGLTYRKDKNGFIWESSFSIVGPTDVDMESTIDPSHASSEKFISDERGNLTKGMMTYRTRLTAALNDDGKLTLSGRIEHAGSVTPITMTKV